MVNNFRLDLSNKLVYFFCSFLLIFILTFINNYYFYSHVLRTSERVGVQLEKMLVEYVKTNLNKNPLELQKDLIELIKSWSSYSYYNKELTVVDLDNQDIILIKPDKWDYAASTSIKIDINKLIKNESNAFILNSQTYIGEIIITVVKSMSFSITDIYDDITKNVYSKIDGQIILVEDAKKNLYDGLININSKLFEEIKGAKNIVVLNQKDSKKEKYFIPAYNKLNVKEGSLVQNGDPLAEGTIFTAIENFQNIYWLRSRPFVGFTIFTFLILFLFNKRIKLLRSIEEKLKEEKLRLEEDKIKAIEEVEEAKRVAVEELEIQINIAIEEKEELLKKQNKLESEYKLVVSQFKQYDCFVKFAFKETSIDELLEKNRVILGNMFRLIAEKIVYSIFEKNIRIIDKSKDSLDSCLKEIRPLQILSKESINALFAVKNFGNENSHYTNDEREVSLSKTIVIAKELADVIEEYFSLDLQEKVEETKVEITKSGIRKIVKS